MADTWPDAVLAVALVVVGAEEPPALTDTCPEEVLALPDTVTGPAEVLPVEVVTVGDTAGAVGSPAAMAR